MNSTKVAIAINIIGLVLTVLLAVGLTFVVVGCGSGNKVSSEDEQLRKLQAALVAAQSQAANQQADISNLIADISNLNATVANLASTVQLQGQADVTLQTEIDALTATLSALQTQLNTLSSQQVVSQTTINGMLVNIATLQGYNSIVSIIDPCGDAAGIWDEVFLQLSDGTLLASFSDNAAGQNTRFSVLTNGNYVTTDGSNCHVHVLNGVVTW